MKVNQTNKYKNLVQKNTLLKEQVADLYLRIALQKNTVGQGFSLITHPLKK